MDSRTLSKFLRECVKEMVETDNSCTYHMKLDNDFAVYVGWGDGFDPKDETCFHSKSQPEFCVCVKIAEYNPYCPLWENVYMPWYVDDEEVFDTDTSIGTKCDYYNTAKWMLKCYRKMRKLYKDGVITFNN